MTEKWSRAVLRGLGSRKAPRLPDTVRQFPVGKTHAGRVNQYGPPLGFKTIITASKEAVQRHIAEMRAIIKRNKSASQDKLIRELNAVIRGWTNYYRTMAATRTFSHCQNVLYLQLRSWANSRHPNKKQALDSTEILACR